LQFNGLFNAVIDAWLVKMQPTTTVVKTMFWPRTT